MTNFEHCDNVHGAPENVPYIVHESSVARMERQIKRIWVALIVAVCLLFASNAGWRRLNTRKRKTEAQKA